MFRTQVHDKGDDVVDVVSLIHSQDQQSDFIHGLTSETGLKQDKLCTQHGNFKTHLLKMLCSSAGGLGGQRINKEQKPSRGKPLVAFHVIDFTQVRPPISIWREKETVPGEGILSSSWRLASGRRLYGDGFSDPSLRSRLCI